MPRTTPDGHIPFGKESDCTLDICGIEYSIFTYQPSLAANAFLAGLFGLVLLAQTYLGIRWKAWGFMVGVQLGCLVEIIGYIARIMLHKNPFSYLPFVMQTICLTIAPVFFTASIYVTLSKTITHFAPDISRLKPSVFVWIFLPADVICLVLQAVGGAISAKGTGDKNGNKISQAGLSFQLIVLVGFIVAYSDFIIRFLRSGRMPHVNWRLGTFLTGLYSSILLILGRSAFRVVELKDGYQGEMMKHEIPFIVFEGVFTVIAAASLCWGHPGLALKPEDAYIGSGRSSSDSEDTIGNSNMGEYKPNSHAV